MTVIGESEKTIFCLNYRILLSRHSEVLHTSTLTVPTKWLHWKVLSLELWKKQESSLVLDREGFRIGWRPKTKNKKHFSRQTQKRKQKINGTERWNWDQFVVIWIRQTTSLSAHICQDFIIVRWCYIWLRQSSWQEENNFNAERCREWWPRL